MPANQLSKGERTRLALLIETRALIQEVGYSALRVDELAKRAKVAKGTVFSHFGDKDGLLAVIVGEEVMRLLEAINAAPPPQSIEAIPDALAPLIDYIASDRVIFDIMLRYSGATGDITNEIVAQTFYDQIDLCARWIAPLQAVGVIRADQSPALLAEGIQAFLTHVIALSFCALHEHPDRPVDALLPFLRVMMAPPA